jgi:ABC-2 type transport system ATP-binding protein
MKSQEQPAGAPRPPHAGQAEAAPIQARQAQAGQVGAGQADARQAGAGPEPALALRGLRKAFGSTLAVADADLTVRRGAFLGLVGPNGAGKTTLLAMATGLLRPDRGEAKVLGQDVWAEPGARRAKELLGVLPDGLALPGRLTGRELLRYLGLLRGLSAPLVEARTGELLRVLDLEHAEHTLIGDYSAGMRKKIGLATALLHGPELLVLDEPFEAVDPVSAAVVRAILNGFLESGGTVVMSSHAMALVEQLCDHVAVLSHGHMLRSGTLPEVRGGHSLEDAFAELVGAAPARGLSWLRS